MVNLAIPFLLVFAFNVLPLILRVIFLLLTAFLPFLRVAVMTSFLADFLTVYFFLALRFCLTFTVFLIVWPLYVAVNV